MKNNFWKRMLSGVLAVLLLCSNVPAVTFAAENSGLCEHHSVHEGCGYVQAVKANGCSHVCGADCYTMETECVHEHGDCGYAEAVEGIPCDHTHSETCGYAAPVEEIACDHQCDEACAESCVHTCEDGTCGYRAAVSGSDCSHTCVDGTCAYSEGSAAVPCGHSCDEAAGCVIKKNACTHTHDAECSYAEAVKAQPCAYVCEDCMKSEEEPAPAAKEEKPVVKTPSVSVVQPKEDAAAANELKIIAQPSNQYGASGDVVTVSIGADGEGLSYKWYWAEKNSTSFKLTDTYKGNTYKLRLSSANDGRRVYCIVTDKYGNREISDTAILSIRTGLKITKQPVSVTVAEGEKASVKVTAEGDGLTYQWYWAAPGEAFKLTESYKGNTYSVTMDKSRDGRRVYCVVMDRYGNTKQSNVVKLSMKDVLKITKQPVSASGYKGETVKVSLVAEGDEVSYKWYYKNKGESRFTLTNTFNSNNYSVIMDASRDGRQVYCVVKDIYGKTVTSKTVTLTMKNAVNITKQPVGKVVRNGQDAVISLEAEGDELTYKWFWAEAGSTDFIHDSYFKGNSYTMTMNDKRDGRQIYCVVIDKYGNTEVSDTVTVRMGNKVTINAGDKQEKYYADDGEYVTFTVNATGDKLTYKWYTAAPGSSTFRVNDSVTGNSYKLKMRPSEEGRRVYCVVTDKYGYTATTHTVTFEMSTPLRITKQPTDVMVKQGSNAVVSLKAEGDSLNYKWYWAAPGSDVFNLTNTFKGSSYSVEMNKDRDGRRVYCVVIDRYGRETRSDIVTLSMAVPVKILTQPADSSVKYGETVNISFTAKGDGLKYTWYYKNAGASKFTVTKTFTGISYSTKMDATRDGREVYCEVTDKYGNIAKTETVKMTMSNKVKIIQQPKNVGVQKGMMASTYVVAQGDGLTYQWYFKDKGATRFSLTSSFKNDSYYVEMNDARDGRQIYCVITDAYGCKVQTDTVTICIGTILKITQQPKSQTVKQDQPATVTVQAKGDGLTYAWFYKDLSDGTFKLDRNYTGPNYTVQMNSDRDGRKVYCVITDKYENSVTSNTVTITME